MRIITVDFGSSRSHEPFVFDSEVDSVEDGARAMDREEFLQLAYKLPKGTYIVGEYAHLGVPRRKNNLSHPFIEEELLYMYKICEENGVIMRFFPESQCPKALGYAKLPKSEKYDPVATYKYITEVYGLKSLMKPKKHFEMSPVKIEGCSIRSDISNQLDIARRFSYHVPLVKLITNQKLHTDFMDRLQKDTIDVFNIGHKVVRSNKEWGLTAGDWAINQWRFHSYLGVWSCLIAEAWNEEEVRPEQELLLRLRDTGDIMGLRFFKKHILGNSPQHFRGGVLRSNLMFHCFPSYTNDQWKKYLGWDGEDKTWKFPEGKKGFSKYAIFEKRNKKGVVEKESLPPDLYQIYRECLKKHRTAIFDLFKCCRDFVNENRQGARVVYNEE